MCGGGSAPKPKPPKPVQPEPVQPPPIKQAAADVKVGAKEEDAVKRRKIGRSQLKSNIGGSASSSSGLGS